MIRMSASELARVERCPASASLPRVERITAAAERGTELHAEKAAESPDGAEVAFAFDVMSGVGRELGRGIGRAYGQLGDTEIAGTTDKVMVEPERVVIRDYKSGWGNGIAPPRENIQLGFYAVAAADVYGKSAARVELEFLDRGVVQSADLDAFDLASLRARLANIWNAATAPHPRLATGEHCTYCPCISRCPAYTTLACAFSEGMWPAALPAAAEGLTAETVARGWKNLKDAKRLLGEVERAYRGFASLWPVPLGDGKVLAAREVERESLDGAVTWQVVRDLHGQDVADAAVTRETTKRALEAAIGTVATKGGKAAAVRAALEAIRNANGVNVKRTIVVDEYQEESK